MAALWLALLATLVEFRCVLGAPLAAGLLGPCLAWVSYAAALTLWIAAHNPGHSSVLATGGKRITGTKDSKGQQAQGTGEEDQVSGHACVLAQTKTCACMHAVYASCLLALLWTTGTQLGLQRSLSHLQCKRRPYSVQFSDLHALTSPALCPQDSRRLRAACHYCCNLSLLLSLFIRRLAKQRTREQRTRLFPGRCTCWMAWS